MIILITSIISFGLLFTSEPTSAPLEYADEVQVEIDRAPAGIAQKPEVSE